MPTAPQATTEPKAPGARKTARLLVRVSTQATSLWCSLVLRFPETIQASYFRHSFNLHV
jgi:hypothetical protein